MDLLQQAGWLLLISIPVACVAWTVTHEEIFREPREFCKRYSEEGKQIFVRKFFYIFTCEYCFSHYITIIFLIITKFHLLYPDWRGYLISGFSIVWIANNYMSLYNMIRVDIKKDNIEAKVNENKLEE
jgi:hypothetical protein